MTLPPTLKTAMTPFPYSVEADAPLEEAQDLMREQSVRHLPVTEGHRIVGVVTDRDILAAISKAKNSKKSARLTVKDACVADVYVVDLNEPIENVLLTLAERHIGSAIVTRQGRLAGVFTTMDACRSFGEYLQANFPRPDGDQVA